ncbi:MAG: hypothetical protein PUC37_08845 [Spirochaetales bacterium]|nr:hypothetical protein [Spirochaetales bacterium]
MKKDFLLILSLSILLISCSKKEETVLLEYNQSIKNEVILYNELNTWNASSEENRLNENILYNENIAKRNVALTPENVKILSNYKEPVYPVIKGYFSLDTSLMESQAILNLNNFLNDFSSHMFLSSQSYFDNSYVFNLVFFIEDLKQNWNKKFNVEFPEREKSIFTNWYIGKGEYSENVIKVPLRLFCAEGFLDITAFINYSKNYRIFLIEIDDWGGKANG